jgi:hypothetical protein
MCALELLASFTRTSHGHPSSLFGLGTFVWAVWVLERVVQNCISGRGGWYRIATGVCNSVPPCRAILYHHVDLVLVRLLERV